MTYDIAIVGAGPAGLFAALELASKTKLSVLLLEQVKRLHDTRNVSNGWMGGSAKSDLKIFTDGAFGGEIDDGRVMNSVVTYLQKHSKTKVKYVKDQLSKRLVKRIEGCGVEIDEPSAILIPSDKLTNIENSFQQFLLEKITIKSNCRVDNVRKEGREFVIETGDKTYRAKKCILALGRGGANWLINLAKDLDITYKNNAFDLGVRLEFPHNAIREIADKSSVFRLKFGEYRTTALSVKGTVEMENVDENKTSNSRSMAGKETHCSSMGLLKTFSQDNALEKLLRLVQIANILADGQLIKEPVGKILTDTSVLTPIAEFASLKSGIIKLFEVFPEISSRCYLYAPEARLNVVRFDLYKHM